MNQDEKPIICLVDGWCKGNGTISAEGGGSFAVYTPVLNNAPTLKNLIRIDEVELLDLLGDENLYKLQEHSTFVIPRESNTKITNNLCEAKSMLSLISYLVTSKLLNRHNTTPIVICSDSQLVINQLNGSFSIKNKYLLKIYQDIYKILGRAVGDVIDFVHIWGTRIFLKKISGNAMKQSVISH